MAHEARKVPLELCRAYFRHEHGVDVLPAGHGAPTFDRDPLLGTVQRRRDLRALRTLMEYGAPNHLSKRALRRLRVALGRAARPQPAFTLDGAVPAGLVLVPRKTGSLIALRRDAEQVVKLEPAAGRTGLANEMACLEQLQRAGLSSLSARLLEAGTITTEHGDVHFVRTAYQRAARPAAPADWPSLLRARVLPKLFAFYGAWGVQPHDACAYLDRLERRLSALALRGATAHLMTLLRRTREASRTEVVHSTRCHGDLQPHNVLVQGGAPKIIDWAQSIEANLFFDLTGLFLDAHHHTHPDVRERFLSAEHVLNVADSTTCGAAHAFVGGAARLTGRRYGPADLAFHVLCGFAERLLFWAEEFGCKPHEQRTHLRMLRTLDGWQAPRPSAPAAPRPQPVASASTRSALFEGTGS